jgi:hypothetical protein
MSVIAEPKHGPWRCRIMREAKQTALSAVKTKPDAIAREQNDRTPRGGVKLRAVITLDSSNSDRVMKWLLDEGTVAIVEVRRADEREEELEELDDATFDEDQGVWPLPPLGAPNLTGAQFFRSALVDLSHIIDERLDDDVLEDGVGWLQQVRKRMCEAMDARDPDWENRLP